MKKIAATLLLLVILTATANAAIPPRPATLVFVNDMANLLSASEEAQLTGLLTGIKNATTAEVVIVTVPTTDGVAAFDFAQRLFTEWGIGDATKNNGLLMLVSVAEREFRFHVGYGLEGPLPDGVLGSLHRAHIVPNFGEGRFFAGLQAVLLTDGGIIPRLEREYNVTIDRGTNPEPSGNQSAAVIEGGLNIIMLIVLVILLSTRGGRGLMWFLLGQSMGNMNRRNRGGPFGGGFGGGGFGGGGFGGGRSGGGGAGGRW